MKLNHEIRFKVDFEISKEINNCHNNNAKCLSKSEFERAIFIEGLNLFKEKINKGLIPNYILEEKKHPSL